jgi:hypothetical protein
MARWEADQHAQAASGLGVRRDRGAVGVGDGGDDRQAKPVAVAVTGAGTIQAFKRQEQPGNLRRRHRRTAQNVV